MEQALYCPVYGFYEKEKDTIGRRGDYYTSVSVGSLLGELLAFQFAEWLKGAISVQNPDTKVQIVEAGAHRGDLAHDILNWLRQQRPDLFARIEYWIIEPSSRRQAWQSQALKEFLPTLRWSETLGALVAESAPSGADRSGVLGVIFSNELLDAMPVRRFGWDARQKAWFEWGVSLQGDAFIWARLPAQGDDVTDGQNHAPFLAPLPPELLAVLPDGFTVDVSPAAEQWWRQAAAVLAHGKLLTLDYGLEEDELLLPQRREGTLRAYYRHRPGSDLLAAPGEQDLTAHVNFTRIRGVGEAAGLKTEALVAQAQFLTAIAAPTWNDPRGFGEWTSEKTRQFQTLTHPEHLGRAFRVLVQSRG